MHVPTYHLALHDYRPLIPTPQSYDLLVSDENATIQDDRKKMTETDL